MGFEFIKKLPTPDEIRNQYPIDAKIKALKEKRDQEIRDVFTGKSDKFLAIIGPCSADNEDAVCDYLLRLRKVQDKIADKVLIIPRVYTNKPRTTGEGYKGMVHQQIRRKNLICLPVLLPSEKCTSVLLKRADLPVRTRCFTQRTGVTFPICFPMLL